jgi:hypothetical protein
MANFFARNINNKGQMIRGISGLMLLVAGVITLFFLWWLGLVLLVSAAFVLFEALRGWCVMRACGIKTKL